MLFGCTPVDSDAEAVGPDAGDAAENAAVATCTRTASEWTLRCAAGERRDVWLPGTDARACDALTGDLQDYATLALALQESSELGALRFRAGPWALRRVVELFDAMADGVSADEGVASSSVVEAFRGCADHGVLAPETRTPVCDLPGSVVGVTGAECAELDAACSRGYLEVDRGCCGISLSIDGATCATPAGNGACTESGSCDAGRERISTGAPAWAEVLPAHSAPPVMGDWHSDDGRVVLQVAEVWELEARPTEETPEHGEVGWVELSDGPDRVVASRLDRATHGVDGVLVHSTREGTRHLFIHRPVEASELAEFEIAVTRTPVDTLGLMARDGSTLPAGMATVVSCTVREDQAPLDSTDGPLACEYDERSGVFFVRGEGITAAWIRGTGREEIRNAGRMAPPVARELTGTTDRFSEQPCQPGVIRTCSHPCGGTGVRACSGPGRGWGPCVRTERCNNCDDDRDSRVDEGGNSLCDDGASCSVDSCASLPAGGGPRVSFCLNSPRPQVCGRGRCTYGVCNGTVASIDDIVPERVVPGVAGPTGCQWAEDDDWCESNLDNCVCNGYSRCDGTFGPLWLGVTDPPPPIQNQLYTSLASCRQRGPTERRHEPGDAAFSPVLCTGDGQCGPGETCVQTASVGLCQPIRNGGCDTNRDPCTRESVCIEPFPEQCVLTNNPVGIETNQRLATDPFVDRVTGVIDGRPVTCADRILNTDLPPFPFGQLCYGPDGNPCTNDVNIACNTETGACALPMPIGAGTVVPEGDVIGFFVDGLGLGTINAVGCEGDPYEVLSVPVGNLPPVVLQHSCYTRSCQSDPATGGPYCGVTNNNDVCVAGLPGNECGGQRFCTGDPRFPESVTESIDVSLPGNPPLFGCRRFGTQCYSHPFDECLDPEQRLVTGTDEQEYLHCFECGANSENLAPLPGGEPCGVIDSFGNRCGVCGMQGECITTSPDEDCGEL